jgi:hypothetical protein
LLQRLTYPILLDFKLVQHAGLFDQPICIHPKSWQKPNESPSDATKEAKPFTPVIMDENSS